VSPTPRLLGASHVVTPWVEVAIFWGGGAGGGGPIAHGVASAALRALVKPGRDAGRRHLGCVFGEKRWRHLVWGRSVGTQLIQQRRHCRGQLRGEVGVLIRVGGDVVQLDRSSWGHRGVVEAIDEQLHFTYAQPVCVRTTMARPTQSQRERVRVSPTRTNAFLFLTNAFL
jgi:hypothetical protein